MNILLTGGAGYVGGVCAAELAARRHTVFCYDNLSAGHRRAVRPPIKFIEGDIADGRKLTSIVKRHQIEAVMHFAASALVDVSIKDPHVFYWNNVRNSLEMLDVLLRFGVKKFIFSSSAAVYGEPKQVPIKEDHPTQPVNAYGETKLALEKALAWYHRAYGLNCIALRYFNASGAWRELGEDHRPETHLLPRLLDAALRSGTVDIYGEDYPTPDGTCVRDFVHVRDIADAHILALRALPKIRLGIYNVGYGRGHSIRQVVKAVEAVTGKKLRIRIGPRRVGDPAVLVANPKRLYRDLAWRPHFTDLQSIVSSAWAWKLAHPEGYR